MINCPSGRSRIVRPGDTLFIIALNVGTTVNELLRLNPGIDPQNLQIGQRVCLPLERECPSGNFWVIAAGDTLYSIANATGTTVERLRQLNPDVNPENLQIDSELCLPD